MKRMKQIGMVLLAFLIYFFVPNLALLPIGILNINMSEIPYVLKTIYALLPELLVALLLILIFYKDLKAKFKDLMKNHKLYFDKYINFWFIMLALMMISNFIVMFFDKSGPVNQNIIEEIFIENPFYIFISAVVFAPLVEELLFRLGLRHIFKNDILYILFSGLLFGFLHIVSAPNIVSELIYLIPYSIPGFVLAYVMVKSKNIYVPMGIHFIHNGFLIAIQFLTLVLR